MKNSALKISAIFFLISATWILLTDKIVLYILPVDSFVLGQNIKGIFFVVVTSILIYYLVQREQKSLIESRGQYKRLFEENPVPMWIYDPGNGAIEAVNRSALESYQYSQESFLNLKVHDLIPETISGSHNIDDETLKDFTDNGISIHQNCDGQPIFVKAKIHETVFNRKKLKIVMALNLHSLIVAENKVHKQNEKLKEIAQFQSHSLRKPVANILGLVSLFNQENTNDKMNVEVIHKLRNETKDLDNIIKSVVKKSSQVDDLEQPLIQNP